MVKYSIFLSDFVEKEEERVGDLERFLKEKLGTRKVSRGNSELIIEIRKKISKDLIRDALRKFLHKERLKEKYRVISKEASSFLIKKK